LSDYNHVLIEDQIDALDKTNSKEAVKNKEKLILSSYYGTT